MRIGLYLAYWPWFTHQEQIELAQLADRLGLDSIWVSEAWGHDVVSVLGLLAGKTERIALGSGLMQTPARQPSATAMAAAGLSLISDGRFRLGLGPSGPQVSEGWYGVSFKRPVARTREYIEIVRKILAREVLTHQGEQWTIPLSEERGGSGYGKPLKLLAKPPQEKIPIYLGSVGPKALELTGEVADGWLPFMLRPQQPEVLIDNLKIGLDKAGRNISEIDIAPIVPVGIHEDLTEARHLVRPWLAFYLGAMGAKNKNFYVQLADKYGHGDSARACQEAMEKNDRIGAAMALSDGLIDCACVCTTPENLTERLAAYAEIGVDTFIAIPSGDKVAAIEALAAAQEHLS